MKRIILITLFLGLFSSPGLSEEDERISVLLPAFPPAVVFTENESGNKVRVLPKREGRFAELYIHPRVNPDNPDEYYIPEDFFAAVRELKAMLPQEFLDAVLEKYGYVKTLGEGEKPRRIADDLTVSILALNYFLFNIWDLGNKDQILARQMDCMGMFELNMTALYVELVLQEILDNGGDYTRDMEEAVYLTGRLKGACLLH